MDIMKAANLEGHQGSSWVKTEENCASKPQLLYCSNMMSSICRKNWNVDVFSSLQFQVAKEFLWISITQTLASNTNDVIFMGFM